MGETVKGEVMPMTGLNPKMGRVVVAGKVFFADMYETRRPGVFCLTFDMTDFNGSVRVTRYMQKEEKDALKRDGWGRLKWKVMRAMGGLNFRDMADGEFLYCLLQMILDGEEQLEKLCPSCRGKLGQEGCPVCGTVTFGENPNFDESRFEELKKHGSFEVDMESAGDGV